MCNKYNLMEGFRLVRTIAEGHVLSVDKTLLIKNGDYIQRRLMCKTYDVSFKNIQIEQVYMYII